MYTRLPDGQIHRKDLPENRRTGTMGGQIALNLAIEAQEKGVWEKYGVELIGVDIDAINITEDREQFRQLMAKIGVGTAPCKIARSYLKAWRRPGIGFGCASVPRSPWAVRVLRSCMTRKNSRICSNAVWKPHPSTKYSSTKRRWLERVRAGALRDKNDNDHHHHHRKPRPDGYPHRRLDHHRAGRP